MPGPGLGTGPGPMSGSVGHATIVANGSLTSTALVTGGGATAMQTPSATSTLSATGNLAIPGTFVLGGNQTISVGQTTSAQTDLLINPTTKASGNFIEAQTNGVAKFKVDSTGAVYVGANMALDRNGAILRVNIDSGVSTLQLYNDGALRMTLLPTGVIGLGGATSAFPGIKRNSTAINFRLADDSGDAPITAGAITGASITSTSSIQTGNGSSLKLGAARSQFYSSIDSQTALANSALTGQQLFTLGGTVPTPIGGAPSQAQSLSVIQSMELLTIAAAATSTTTMLVPAGAIVLSVSVRNTVAIPTAATYTVKLGATEFNTVAVPVAINTTDPGTKAGAFYNATAQGVVITPDLTPGTNVGRVRVTVSYILITPPTS